VTAEVARADFVGTANTLRLDTTSEWRRIANARFEQTRLGSVLGLLPAVEESCEAKVENTCRLIYHLSECAKERAYSRIRANGISVLGYNQTA
jgi:hypothetical protein